MIGITGASSAIGQAVLAAAKASGVEAVPLGRASGSGVRPYDLFEPLREETLSGLDAVIHLAWSWDGPAERNAAAGCELAQACAARKIRPILLSTLSAFAAARSRYGAAKVCVEAAFLEAGGDALRGGLIWGGQPAGILATLCRLASLPVISPRLWPDPLMRHSHETELAQELVKAAVSDESAGIVVAASQETLPLGRLMATLRRSSGGLNVPVPVRALELVAVAAECLHIPTPFRADSLAALSTQAEAAIRDTRLPWLEGFAGTQAFFSWAQTAARQP